MNCVRLELPYPPSLNRYYRHWGARVLISREGRIYRENVEAIIRTLGTKKFDSKTSLTIDVYPPDSRRRDLDNINKALLDALVSAKLLKDDSLIDELHMIKREPMPERNGFLYLEIKDFEQ